MILKHKDDPKGRSKFKTRSIKELNTILAFLSEGTRSGYSGSALAFQIRDELFHRECMWNYNGPYSGFGRWYGD